MLMLIQRSLLACFVALPLTACASKPAYPENSTTTVDADGTRRTVTRVGNGISVEEVRGGTVTITCGRVVQMSYIDAQSPAGRWDPTKVPAADRLLQPGRSPDTLWVSALNTIALDELRRANQVEVPDGDLLGAQWLAGLQRPDGALVSTADDPNVDLLDHSLATLALLRHVERHPESPLQVPAVRAAEYLASSALPQGGWSRHATDEVVIDSRTTAWAVVTLHYAERRELTDDSGSIDFAVTAFRRFEAELHATPTSELHRFVVESIAGARDDLPVPDADWFMPIESAEDGSPGNALHDPEPFYLYLQGLAHTKPRRRERSSQIYRSLQSAGLLNGRDEFYLWRGDDRARGGALAAFGLNSLSMQVYFRSGNTCCE